MCSSLLWLTSTQCLCGLFQTVSGDPGVKKIAVPLSITLIWPPCNEDRIENKFLSSNRVS